MGVTMSSSQCLAYTLPIHNNPCYCIVYYALFLVNSSVVESYSPNPRAVHPDGRLPTTGQAEGKLLSIRNALCKNGPPIILIDGNNIRNSFGFQAVSALGLTKKLSSRWLEDQSDAGNDSEEEDDDTGASLSNSNIICLWDGGSEVMSAWANSTLAVFSGPDGNADDLLVQCCAFLSQELQNIVAFSSDANLANRCKMQMTEESSSGIQFQIYHSIYLCLLLDGIDEQEDDSGQHDFTPDWERQERRKSVEGLQLFLTDFDCSRDVRVMENPLYKARPVQEINMWIDSGMHGLKTGRVTKGGSVLYRMV
jgi:hypothetical protein